MMNLEEKRYRVNCLRQKSTEVSLIFDEILELGELYLGLRQNTHAEDNLKQAIDIDPIAPRPRFLLCLVLLGFNQPTATLLDTNQSNEFKIQYQWLKSNCSDLLEVQWLSYLVELDQLSKIGDWRKALETGSIAVCEFPDNYLLQFMYAVALLHFGRTNELKRSDYEVALLHMRLASELNPDFEPAIKNVPTLEDLMAKAKA